MLQRWVSSALRPGRAVGGRACRYPWWFASGPWRAPAWEVTDQLEAELGDMSRSELVTHLYELELSGEEEAAPE